MSPKANSKAAPVDSKLDLLKLHKADYVAPKKPVLLDIKPARYLAVEGVGTPGGEVFQSRIGALYAMAYTLKMTRKFEGQQNYTIGKLEARYLNFDQTPLPKKDAWHWQLLIRTPEFVSDEELTRAVAALSKRGKQGDAPLVKLMDLNEGNSVQLLHVGPYDTECASFALMETFAKKQGLSLLGQHHEIYISDPRRVEPAMLKTILRAPVSKCS